MRNDLPMAGIGVEIVQFVWIFFEIEKLRLDVVAAPEKLVALL